MPDASNNDAALYESYFHAGVTACLRSWPVLRTAVERGWGSAEAANDLRTNLIANSRTDPIDMADAIAVYMEEEFSVTLEDGSETSIANMVARLYHDCIVQRRTVVLHEVLAAATAPTIANNEQQSRIQVVQPSEYDEDDDDDDEAMILETSTTTSALLSSWTPEALIAYGQQPLFGSISPPPPTRATAPVRQLGQSAAAAPTTSDDNEAMVDDDGFAPVVTRKHRNRTQ